MSGLVSNVTNTSQERGQYNYANEGEMKVTWGLHWTCMRWKRELDPFHCLWTVALFLYNSWCRICWNGNTCRYYSFLYTLIPEYGYKETLQWQSYYLVYALFLTFLTLWKLYSKNLNSTDVIKILTIHNCSQYSPLLFLTRNILVLKAGILQTLV